MSEWTTLGELVPGELFETKEPSHYGSRGMVGCNGSDTESEVLWYMDSFRKGESRWLPNSTIVRRVPWPAEAT